MADMEKAQLSINQAIESLISLKKALGETPDPKPEIKTEVSIEVPITETDSDFEQLRKLVDNDKWPEAVNHNLICDPNSEKEKLERSRGIVELMIEDDLKNTRFLDFGCGEGYSVRVATEYEPQISVGFDVKISNKWENKDKQIFTNDFEQVKSNGPYDTILIFDVIDHLSESDPATVLTKLKSVLADNGKIYMRCHPWTSRHGNHLYHSKNKAFLHLVFTENELKQIIPNPQHSEISIGVKYPIKDYNHFISEAKLQILNRRDMTESVEAFFKIPKIAQRIIDNTEMEGFPEFQMSIQFIDYVLGK